MTMMVVAEVVVIREEVHQQVVQMAPKTNLEWCQAAQFLVRRLVGAL